LPQLHSCKAAHTCTTGCWHNTHTHTHTHTTAPRPTTSLRIDRSLRDFGLGKSSITEGGLGLFTLAGALLGAGLLWWARGTALRKGKPYAATLEFPLACGITVGTPVRRHQGAQGVAAAGRAVWCVPASCGAVAGGCGRVRPHTPTCVRGTVCRCASVVWRLAACSTCGPAWTRWTCSLR
jgi:hypothetical protein